MVPEKRNPRAAGTVQGASEVVLADGSENSTRTGNFKAAGAVADLVVRRLAARHGLTLPTARVVAELAGFCPAGGAHA